MKLQRTIICIAGVLFAVGFAASQAPAGTGVPGCGTEADPETGEGFMEIEVNALRAGGKTITTGPNQTVNVTAKARILKGTADPDTVMDTTLTIQAVDGVTVVGSASTDPGAIRIGVGKGGKGAKLSVPVTSCNSGFTEFVATFAGVDAENDPCIGTTDIRKACR